MSTTKFLASSYSCRPWDTLYITLCKLVRFCFMFLTENVEECFTTSLYCMSFTTRISVIPVLVSSASCYRNVSYFIASTFFLFFRLFCLMLKIAILCNIFCIFNSLINFNIFMGFYINLCQQVWDVLVAVGYSLPLNDPINVCTNNFPES